MPPSQLVKGNGLIEGLTVGSIILGIVLGGQLIGTFFSPMLLGLDLPLLTTGVDTAPEAAIAVIVAIYLIAALFNLRIPRTDAPLQPMSTNLGELVRDFSLCNSRLWSDKLGQITLASTTLLWGIFGNLRVIVFAWAAAALGYNTAQASNLAGVVIVGSIVGVSLERELTRLQQDTLEHELLRHARAARASASVLQPDAAIAVTDALADRMGDATGARITLISAEGVVVGDSALSIPRLAEEDNHSSRPEVITAPLRSAFPFTSTWKPPLPASLRLGKNMALATPIFAVAAAS